MAKKKESVGVVAFFQAVGQILKLVLGAVGMAASINGSRHVEIAAPEAPNETPQA